MFIYSKRARHSVDSYSEQIVGYLNTSAELDRAVFNLWRCWEDLDIEKAKALFSEAVAESGKLGNLMRPETYGTHCLKSLTGARRQQYWLLITILLFMDIYGHLNSLLLQA
jgi:hypothetical protein